MVSTALPNKDAVPESDVVEVGTIPQAQSSSDTTTGSVPPKPTALPLNASKTTRPNSSQHPTHPLRLTPAVRKPSLAKDPKKGKKSGAVRGSGFTAAETDWLLTNLKVCTPLCKDEWDAVLVEHNKRFADNLRTVDSLRRKFASFHRKKMPTGDPLMPDDVRRAKEVRSNMTERAEMGCGEEETDEITGIVEEDGAETPASEGDPSPTPSNNEGNSEQNQRDSDERSVSPLLPRPLVAKRKAKEGDKTADMMDIMRMSFIQYQQQCADETIRRMETERRKEEEREQERKRREEIREEERLRREHESKRQDRFMETMLLMFGHSVSRNVSRNDNTDP